MLKGRPTKRQKLTNPSSSVDQLVLLALKTITRATKKAKTFEIQHLIRKIRLAKEGKPTGKASNSKPVPTETLEADLHLLKTINVEKVAQKILYGRLKRHTVDLIDNSIFEAIRTPDNARQLDRIENKICSDKRVAEVAVQTVAKLVPQLQSATGGRTGLKPESGNRREELSGKKLDEAVARELEALESGSRSDSDSEGLDSESSVAHTSSGSASDEAFPSDHESTPIPKPERPKPSTRLPPVGRASESTFLPALNVGYTIGDSDASGSEIDDRALDRLEKERGRKNRRGQQARRLIWERKYGKEAKHLRKLKDRQQATASAGCPPFEQGWKKAAVQQKTNPNAEPIGQRQKVHPSWEAKQKQLHALSVVKPSGKKIVFD